MEFHTESKSYQALIARWEQRARTAQEDLYDERMARVIRQIVEESRACRQQEFLETVTVKEAVELTGYSESTIYRHLETGKLQNVGTERNVLLRVRDLPFRSGPETFHPALLSRNAASAPNPQPTRPGQAPSKLTLLDDSA